MNERVKKLAEEISKLPPEEQADLIDQLIVLTYRARRIPRSTRPGSRRRSAAGRYRAGLIPLMTRSRLLRKCALGSMIVAVRENPLLPRRRVASLMQAAAWYDAQRSGFGDEFLDEVAQAFNDH